MMFFSATAEAIDKWFEDLQSYEATLEEMAAASLDVNFKEEVSVHQSLLTTILVNTNLLSDSLVPLSNGFESSARLRGLRHSIPCSR